MSARIVTLTMHPCVDETLWYRAWGEPPVRREEQSGGKGINVARVLANLGENCAAVAPLGGAAGARCETLARREGVGIVPVPAARETRTVTTHALEINYEQRVDYERGAPYSADELEAIRNETLAQMEGAQVFAACGSAPDPAACALIRQLLAEAKRRGLITVLDANGDALIEGWKSRPQVVKPNEQELRQILGREIPPDGAYAAAEELAREGATALVTLGKRGAVCADNGNLYCVPAPRVKTVNPVGSGDTFLAAWLHARIHGLDPFKALEFACELAAQNAAMFAAARVGRDAGGPSAPPDPLTQGTSP